jgi:hypothetical protein
MSGKSRALAVAAATAGLIALWAPAALASPAGGPLGGAPLGTNGWLVNGGIVNGALVNGALVNGALVNSGPVNINFGSGNTAIGNTCNNTNQSGPLGDNILTWALDISHNACVMAGGPAHF